MRVFKYLKKYWFVALLAPLTMVVEVLCDLNIPKLMTRIVNEGINGSFSDSGERIAFILTIGAAMLAVALIGGLGGLMSSYFASRASQSFARDLRIEAFKKVMSLSYQQTDRFTTGSLVTRLSNDITMLQDIVAMALRMFVRSPLMFIGGVIFLLAMSPKFALALLITLPLELIVMVIFLRKASPLFTVVQKRLDNVNSVVQENVGGARVVKAYVREEYETERFQEANIRLMESNYRVQKLLATLMPLMIIILNLTTVGIMYIGGIEVDAGNLLVGDVMAAITYITMVLMSLMMIGMMFQGISRAAASAKRVLEVLDSEPAISGGSRKDGIERGTVSFRNVTFSYPGASGEPVLKDISIDIKNGETFAILGSTGSGKSSLINLIPRFYDPDSGEILVDGVNVREYDLKSLRDKIGVVPQQNQLYAGSVSDNIRWGKKDATDEEVRDAARIAQADGFIESFSNGYDTDIGERGASLSGGQKQRVAIARAVVKKPEIIIFDDSTSALDLTTDTNLRRALRAELKGTTVIMIAQRVASVMTADRIAVLDNGRIAAVGSHGELMDSSAVYRDIYDSQLNRGGDAE